METVYPEALCVFSADIKASAVTAYMVNYGDDCKCDLTTIDPENIPDIDLLMAGFPCQAFSSAGKRRGFEDTRGTIFFFIMRIVQAKRPVYVILENVEGLLTHAGGKTLNVILETLKEAGYHVTHKVISGIDVGVPQDRRRLFIVGVRNDKGGPYVFDLSPPTPSTFSDVMEHGIQEGIISDSVSEKLLERYTAEELHGKKINDKRGGDGNIHSWDLGLKGDVSLTHRELMSKFLTQRRRKSWAITNKVTWSDGMALSVSNIETFHNVDNLDEILTDLVRVGYLKETEPGWYDMYGGKLSFSIAHILDPERATPTIVATDADKLAVVDGGVLRRLTLTEVCRLFGYDGYDLSCVTRAKALDLLGNSVIVPVIESILDEIDI